MSVPTVVAVAAKCKPRIPGGCAPAGPGSTSSSLLLRHRGVLRIVLLRVKPPRQTDAWKLEIMLLACDLDGRLWRGYARERNAEIPAEQPTLEST